MRHPVTLYKCSYEGHLISNQSTLLVIKIDRCFFNLISVVHHIYACSGDNMTMWKLACSNTGY